MIIVRKKRAGALGPEIELAMMLREEITALEPRDAFAPEYRTPLQTMLRDSVSIGSPSFLPQFQALRSVG